MGLIILCGLSFLFGCFQSIVCKVVRYFFGFIVRRKGLILSIFGFFRLDVIGILLEILRFTIVIFYWCTVRFLFVITPQRLLFTIKRLLGIFFSRIFWKRPIVVQFTIVVIVVLLILSLVFLSLVLVVFYRKRQSKL